MKTNTGIAFDDVGDGGPALILLPGWCATRTVFRPLLADAARNRRVLAVDWRGHGGSDPAAADFGFRELLDDVRAVLDMAGVDRVIPVGTAHAGWTAIDLRHALGPDRVPGVVLVDWMVLGAPPPFAGALAGLQDPARWEQVRAQLFAMWTTGVTSQPVLDFIDEMASFGEAMWARAAREIGARFAAQPRPLAALESDGCPTLHVYAQPADPGVLAAQQDYARSHPWFEVHRLTAASHFPSLEVPHDLGGRIEAFAAARG